MNIKMLSAGVGAVIIILVAAVAWWLLSPLFVDKKVNEAFPLSAAAAVPADMTQAEVEQVMLSMAKVNQSVDEVMPQLLAETLPAENQPAPAAGDTAISTPTALKTGSFQDADNFHQGSGSATIYRGADGSMLLRLEDLDVTNGPDLHVILTPNANPQSRQDVSDQGYVDLGSIKGNQGNQNYEIPADVDIESLGSVVIYCQPFHVIFSVASLQSAS